VEPHHVTITIRKLEDLFVDRIEENPLVPEWEANAGIQRVADYLQTRRLGRGVHVTVRIPDTLPMTAARREKVHAAILRYCDSRIRENRDARRFTIFTGLIGLAYSAAVSIFLSLVTSWALSLLTVLPLWLYEGLAVILVVAAWAILWGPLQAVFYDWLPNFVNIRVYRTIQRGAFTFEHVKMSEPEPDF
jgi:cellulose synthase/poly-beta-1,6-N-acetylglucosamine synthase-like glycosyltransferase